MARTPSPHINSDGTPRLSSQGDAAFTLSYNEALLTGKMTRAEIESVRAELAGDAEDARTSGPSERRVQLSQVITQLDAGDHAGALALAERALEQDPSNVAAQQLVERCRKLVTKVSLSQLGTRSSIPRIVLPPHRLAQLSLDGAAGFVLSRIDGVTTIDELLDITGLARVDTLQILVELVDHGVVVVEHPV